jgi:hypothetical protein
MQIQSEVASVFSPRPLPCPACGGLVTEIDLAQHPTGSPQVVEARSLRLCPNCSAPVRVKTAIRVVPVLVIFGLAFAAIWFKHELVPAVLPDWGYAVGLAILVGSLPILCSSRALVLERDA